MNSYSQFTLVQRYQIEALHGAHYCQQEIAAVLGHHKSSISREFRRNCSGGMYNAQAADARARWQREGKARRRIDEALRGLVEDLLEEDRSPEQISGWLAKEGDQAVDRLNNRPPNTLTCKPRIKYYMASNQLLH